MRTFSVPSAPSEATAETGAAEEGDDNVKGVFVRLRFKFDEDLLRPEPVRYRDPAR